LNKLYLSHFTVLLIIAVFYNLL